MNDSFVQFYNNSWVFYFKEIFLNLNLFFMLVFSKVDILNSYDVKKMYLNKNLYNKKRRLIDFTILQLLQHNIQLGCLEKFSLLTSSWFIYGIRNNMIIINLTVTILYVRKMLFLLECIIMNRYHVLFFSEYCDLNRNIVKLVRSCGEQYLFGKWIGGLLTNFRHLWVTYKSLCEVKFTKNDTMNVINYNKYRQAFKLLKRRVLLREALDGVYYVSSIPGAVFLAGNLNKYKSAVKEAYILRLPIGGLLDADNNVGPVMYPIPSNDDSFESVVFYEQLFIKSIYLNKLELISRLYRNKLYFLNN